MARSVGRGSIQVRTLSPATLTLHRGATSNPPPPPTPRQEEQPYDQDWNDAGELLQERGVDLGSHRIMHENLATYLSHRGWSGISSERWQTKIDRELAQPYADREVYEHLEALEDSLQDNLRELPSMPSKLFITGSFAKGRLGANSDLDGYAVLPPEQVPEAFDLFVEREKNPRGANLFPFASDSAGYNQAHLMVSGKSVQVTPRQVMRDGFLREVYDELRADRGRRRETHAVYEWATGLVWSEEKTAEEKRDAFTNDSLGTRLQNATLSMGGTLSRAPLVGPVVNWITDYFVTQDHRDFTGASASGKVDP